MPPKIAKLAASTLVIACSLPSYIRAQGRSASFQPYSHQGSAVDVTGVRHRGIDYAGNPPWLSDGLKKVAPEYPHGERAPPHGGRAIIRLTLDLKTGTVIKAVVAKSTGFTALDDAAITAFQRWTWRPGKWKEIDMPMTFKLGDPHALSPRAVPLPFSYH